ncbi:endonuclease III [Rickettsiales endosymbiont of Stachyamoeba lipophora]|uniref:endonuclease III n=1 Tax=Rickettsiales endosymbiont of Stachyamoeba lipophora TaxID=2486578 RepID=UPI000F654171|nr:endonuclease III [Rickettsiales endosymbiont of Stachyamoeba lipophora]AZL15757.1 endonuclease III [Rickettsiales endosymbiont of Stachyamoeba lipophora]
MRKTPKKLTQKNPIKLQAKIHSKTKHTPLQPLLTLDEIITIFEIFKDLNPHPQTELKFNNLYQLLVAVALSAQSTDISVNKATDILFQQITTPMDMLNLGEDGLKQYIKSIGLYHTKAKNILSLSRILIEQYNSQVPSTFSELIALPGVGHKTAKVVLNCGFGVPIIAVDTHVFRVSQRLGIAYAKTPLELEGKLLTAIPKKYHHDAHHWLILHGRYICKAQQPKCLECKLNTWCKYFNSSK